MNAEARCQAHPGPLWEISLSRTHGLGLPTHSTCESETTVQKILIRDWPKIWDLGRFFSGSPFALCAHSGAHVSFLALLESYPFLPCPSLSPRIYLLLSSFPHWTLPPSGQGGFVDKELPQIGDCPQSISGTSTVQSLKDRLPSWCPWEAGRFHVAGAPLHT